jgi:7-cyano-7-deazaguanine synthase
MSIETSSVRDVLVLLSGGQDSTTCLWWVKRECPTARVHALTITYGQRHASEVHAARAIAALAGCDTWDHVDLSAALGCAQSALTQPGIELKGSGGFVDAEMPEGLPTSFVPGRNLVFLSVAGAWAARYRCQWLVTGVCQTDYSGYPDCRQDFVEAMEDAIKLALPTELNGLSLMAPLLDATKAETVTLAVKIGDPMLWRALGMSVTCYHGRNPGCGECPACALRDKGFREAGIPDPQGKAVSVAAKGPHEVSQHGWTETREPPKPPVRHDLKVDVGPDPFAEVPMSRVVDVASRGPSIELRCERAMTLSQAGEALARYARHHDVPPPTFDHLTLRVDPIQPDGPSHGDRTDIQPGDVFPPTNVHERPTLDLSYEDIGEMVK